MLTRSRHLFTLREVSNLSRIPIRCARLLGLGIVLGALTAPLHAKVNPKHHPRPSATKPHPAPAGGANQVSGLRGKVGQVLFTGKWRFQVVRVDRTASYDTHYQADKDTVVPNGDNDELVVLTCQIRNAQKQAVAPMLGSVHPHNTSLTDDQGQSYPPLKFDKRGGDNDTGGSMLPGSSANFAVLFSVPKGTVLKDLVFSLQRAYDDMPDGGTDVRISLAP